MKVNDSNSPAPSSEPTRTTAPLSPLTARLLDQAEATLQARLPALIARSLSSDPSAQNAANALLSAEVSNFRRELQKSFDAQGEAYFELLDTRLRAARKRGNSKTWRKAAVFLRRCGKTANRSISVMMLPIRYTLHFCAGLMIVLTVVKVWSLWSGRAEAALAREMSSRVFMLEAQNSEMQRRLIHSEGLLRRITLMRDSHGQIWAQVAPNQWPQERAVNGQNAGKWILLTIETN